MERIVFDQRIKRGKPVVAGTRVPVEIVVGSLAGGMTYDEVAAEYGLTREDILACLDYAAQIMSSEQALPIPAATLTDYIINADIPRDCDTSA